MKIFVDTNVFLDIFLKREPFVEDSLSTVNKIIKEMNGFISPITITNMNFIMRKETKENREKAIKYIIKKFKIVELNKDVLEEALTTDFKDFLESTINVFTPEEFLEFYK